MNTQKSRMPVARFKKFKDAEDALKTRDYSKSEKCGKKGWRNARYEIALISQ